MTDQQLQALSEIVTEQEGYYGNEAVDFKAGFVVGYQRAQLAHLESLKEIKVLADEILAMQKMRVRPQPDYDVVVEAALKNLETKGGPY